LILVKCSAQSLNVQYASSAKASSSEDALLVVLEFHDERLYVLAFLLPVVDAFLGVRIEVFLLLVKQCLCL